MRETRQAVCVFVEGGVPRQVRVASLGWERGDGYLEIYNKKSLVYAGRAVGAGDFRLSARLTVWSRDDGPTFVAGTGDVDLAGFARLSYGYWPREVLRHQHLFLEPRVVHVRQAVHVRGGSHGSAPRDPHRRRRDP